MNAQGRGSPAAGRGSSARAALTQLKDQGVEAITVSFMNAYTNGAHEKRVGELAREIMQDVPVS
jgi:N-methylhydantoinase A